jgi:DNA-binding HxlR family transcriptional regulator
MSRSPRPGAAVRGSTTGRPLLAALDLFGHRWMLRVLWELRDGAVGFRELIARCDGISAAVLRARLVELLDAALVEQDAERRYLLTPLGRDVAEAIAPLDAWARRWQRATDPAH